MATYTFNQWIFIVALCYIFCVTLTSEAARSNSNRQGRNIEDIDNRGYRSSKGYYGRYSDSLYKQKSEKPNIILVITDDQDETLDETIIKHARSSTPYILSSAEGSMSTMTKTLKIMEQGGVKFNNSFVSTPMCCPSRSSLLTGLLPHNHHVYTNNENCSGTEWQKVHEPRSFAKYLSDAGYRTGYFGKYLNEYNGTYIPPGWSMWEGLYRNSRYYGYTLNFDGRKEKYDDNYYHDYFTDLIANDSVTFLKQSKQTFRKQPVMMVLSVPAPHGPEDAAPQYQHMFENNTLHRTPSWNFMNNSDKQWLLQKMKPLEPIGMAFTDLLQQKRLQTLQSVDSLMEKLHYELRLLGEIDNTYIIYTSDHGYHLGQFGMVKGKATPYDFDIRVPLYIRGPGILKDTKIPNVVANIDIAPTILDMAGLAVPDHMDGRSMLKLIKNHKFANNLAGKVVETRRPWRDTLLIERGKVTDKMTKIMEKKQFQKFMDEHESELLPYASPKLRRTLKVCRDPANAPPCKLDQKWVCFRDDRNRKRIKKCRNFNKTVTMDNDVLQKDSPYGPSQSSSKKQCICNGKSSHGIYKTDSTPNYYRRKKKRALRSYEDEELRLKRQLIAQQLNSNRQRCRFYPNETFACDKDITKDPEKWQDHKLQIDEMIAETRRRLKNLKKIRKNMKKQKKYFGKDYIVESNKLDQTTRNTFIVDENIAGEPCDCDDDMDLNTEIQIPPELEIESYADDNDSEEVMYNPYAQYSTYGSGKKKGKGKVCNHDELKCTIMSNTHWQTPPYWTLGNYCFCTNAVTNTYWCLRVVNETHNFLYCEFIDNFLSFYDMTEDPHQLENKIKTLTYQEMQELHDELTELRKCKGWKECNKNRNKIHSSKGNKIQKRRRRRRKVRQPAHRRNRHSYAGHRRNIAESQA